MSMASEQDEDEEETPSEAEMKKSSILQKFSPTTIKAILELLCDESVCRLLIHLFLVDIN